MEQVLTVQWTGTDLAILRWVASAIRGGRLRQLTDIVGTSHFWITHSLVAKATGFTLKTVERSLQKLTGRVRVRAGGQDRIHRLERSDVPLLAITEKSTKGTHVYYALNKEVFSKMKTEKSFQRLIEPEAPIGVRGFEVKGKYPLNPQVVELILRLLAVKTPTGEPLFTNKFSGNPEYYTKTIKRVADNIDSIRRGVFMRMPWAQWFFVKFDTEPAEIRQAIQTQLVNVDWDTFCNRMVELATTYGEWITYHTDRVTSKKATHCLASWMVHTTKDLDCVSWMCAVITMELQNTDWARAQRIKRNVHEPLRMVASRYYDTRAPRKITEAWSPARWWRIVMSWQHWRAAVKTAMPQELKYEFSLTVGPDTVTLFNQFLDWYRDVFDQFPCPGHFDLDGNTFQRFLQEELANRQDGDRVYKWLQKFQDNF